MYFYISLLYLLFFKTQMAKVDAILHHGKPLQWCHNGHDSISNHQPHDCLLNRIFRLRSKEISKLLVTGLCAGNSPGTGEFPAQMASNTENASIWWRHHARNHLFYIVTDKATDGLAPPGATASAARILTQFSQNILDSYPENTQGCSLQTSLKHILLMKKYLYYHLQ